MDETKDTRDDADSPDAHDAESSTDSKQSAGFGVDNTQLDIGPGSPSTGQANEESQSTDASSSSSDDIERNDSVSDGGSQEDDNHSEERANDDKESGGDAEGADESDGASQQGAANERLTQAPPDDEIKEIEEERERRLADENRPENVEIDNSTAELPTVKEFTEREKAEREAAGEDVGTSDPAEKFKENPPDEDEVKEIEEERERRLADENRPEGAVTDNTSGEAGFGVDGDSADSEPHAGSASQNESDESDGAEDSSSASDKD